MTQRNVRIKQEDSRVVDELRNLPSVRKEAVEEGVIDDADDAPTFEDIMALVIPDDADQLARPEEEMNWQNAGEMKDKLLELAGENVSVHEVVTHFTEQYADEHGIRTEDYYG